MKLGHILHNVWRYGRSPQLIWTAYISLRNYKRIENSEFYDPTWIRQSNPELDRTGSDPVFFILTDRSLMADPSASFCSAEYAAIHQLPTHICPLLHYERIGKKLGYAVSQLEIKQNGGRTKGIFTHRKISAETIVSSIHDAERAVQIKLSRGKKLNVLFFVYNFSIFPGRPLCDKMLADTNFEVKIIVIPDTRWPARSKALMKACAEEALTAYGSSTVIISNETTDADNRVTSADIICYSTPYNLSTYQYNLRYSFGQKFLPIYFNYSYIVAKFSISVFSSPNFLFFWKVFFENASTLLEYQQNALMGGKNAALCGYVKMDSYSHTTETPRKRKRIIVAPHHSFTGGYNHQLHISNFLEYADLFLRLPKIYPQIDFVFRPHPFFRQALGEKHVWGKQKTDRYFDTLNAYSNVSIYTGPDYFTLFRNSDGLIQDCGSFLAEYFYTGKPQCYILRNKDEIDRAFTSVGKACLNHSYLAYSHDDILTFIDKVITFGIDELSSARESFQKTILLNYPNATSCALDTIMTNLSDNHQ